MDSKNSRVTGVIRILLGLQFVSFGILKPVVPWIWEAWNQQLTQAHLPLAGVLRYIGPASEFALGLLLVLGLKARLGAAGVVGMMLVATYVHSQVDPAYLPLQIGPPIFPLVAIAMAGVVLRSGAGAWSYDGRSGAKETLLRVTTSAFKRNEV